MYGGHRALKSTGEICKNRQKKHHFLPKNSVSIAKNSMSFENYSVSFGNYSVSFGKYSMSFVTKVPSYENFG